MPELIAITEEELIETPTSPQWVFGERITCRQTFNGPYALALAGARVRGYPGSGDQQGMVVAQSSVSRERGGRGALTIEWEWGRDSGPPPQGAELPADECSVTIDRLDTALEKHPRYREVMIGEDGRQRINAIKQLVGNWEEYKDSDKAGWIFDNPTPAGRPAYDGLVVELFDKMKGGATHFLLYVPVYRWRVYSWYPAVGTAGGSLEIPNGPITVPPDVEWIRNGDNITYNGTHWLLEKSWIGAPEWDPDLYTISPY